MNSVKPVKYKFERESAAEKAFKDKYENSMWMIDRMSLARAE